MQRKISTRRCVGCGESKPKKELIRVVRSPEGEISLDETGKKAGRGAYVCREAGCLLKAVKSKRLEKSLSCEVSREIYELLATRLETRLPAPKGASDNGAQASGEKQNKPE